MYDLLISKKKVKSEIWTFLVNICFTAYSNTTVSSLKSEDGKEEFCDLIVL